jgi:hypothetical protein
MKPRTIISLLLGGALLVLCITPQTPANSLNSNSIIKDNIEYYLQTDKAVYNTGEDVQILYRVTNLGSEAVTFRFTAGPVTDRCNFMVEKNGQRIWDNLGRPGTCVMTSFTLDPSASNSFTILWDMTDANDTQVAAADYQVTAALSNLYLSDDKYVPVSVTITVIPTTILVPDDYPTIQHAIDDAFPGDIIMVAPGLYEEHIEFSGKNVTLTSIDPADPNVVNDTIIEGVVMFGGTEDPNCTLTGFNIERGIRGYDRPPRHYEPNHTHATISHCLLDDVVTNCGPTILGCDGLISNCLITEAGIICDMEGAGGAMAGCSGLIRNCTIVGGIGTGSGVCTIENSIIYQYGIGCAVSVPDGSTVNISYTDILGGLDAVCGDGTVNWGHGNIDADPCFVSPFPWDVNGNWVQRDFHLLPNSPCIDAGDPNYVPEPNETDLDGNPRVIGGLIDMGAYEYTPQLAAQVRISPNTLNLRSKGKWLTCYILLPQDCNAADIDPNSILLEDEIPPDRVVSYGRLAMAKFSRPALQQLLSDLQTPAEVELLVSGRLTDGTIFEGADTIRVIGKGHLRGRRVNSNSKVVDDIEYYIQTDKAVYKLGENVQMLYRVTNLGDQEVSMWFPHSPVYNFWVAEDGQDIWRAVNGWWDVITTLVLAPGESKEFPDYYPPQIWDMRDRDGNLVSPGKYTVTSGLYAGSGLWDFTRVSVNVRIISDHIVNKEVNRKADKTTLINTPGHRKRNSTRAQTPPKPKKHGKRK